MLTAQEAGELLGLRPETVRAMGRDGKLPVVHPTGKRTVRYRYSDVMALVKAEVRA